MKNKLTLMIASVLLALCVLQKEARNKAVMNVNEENRYTMPSEIDNNGLISASESTAPENEVASNVVEGKDIFEFASLDSTSQSRNTSRLLNHSLLNISTASKVLINN